VGGRESTFQAPAGLEIFFAGVDKMVLNDNTTLNWLRTLIKPRVGD
jgi:hypothetical protein